MFADELVFRAGVSIFPHPAVGGHSLQTENFKYFWALAHRDPTSGVQVSQNPQK